MFSCHKSYVYIQLQYNVVFSFRHLLHLLHFCHTNSVRLWCVLLLFRWVHYVLLNSIHHITTSFIYDVLICVVTFYKLCTDLDTINFVTSVMLGPQRFYRGEMPAGAIFFTHSCLIFSYIAWYQRDQRGLSFFTSVIQLIFFWFCHSTYWSVTDPIKFHCVTHYNIVLQEARVWYWNFWWNLCCIGISEISQHEQHASAITTVPSWLSTAAINCSLTWPWEMVGMLKVKFVTITAVWNESAFSAPSSTALDKLHNSGSQSLVCILPGCMLYPIKGCITPLGTGCSGIKSGQLSCLQLHLCRE